MQWAMVMLLDLPTHQYPSNVYFTVFIISEPLFIIAIKERVSIIYISYYFYLEVQSFLNKPVKFRADMFKIDEVIDILR